MQSALFVAGRAPEVVTCWREAQELPLGAELLRMQQEPCNLTPIALPHACQRLTLSEKLEERKGKPQRLEEASEVIPLQPAYQNAGHRAGGEADAMTMDSQ